MLTSISQLIIARGVLRCVLCECEPTDRAQAIPAAGGPGGPIPPSVHGIKLVPLKPPPPPGATPQLVVTKEKEKEKEKEKDKESERKVRAWPSCMFVSVA
jgi:hypothetical protein